MHCFPESWYNKGGPDRKSKGDPAESTGGKIAARKRDGKTHHGMQVLLDRDSSYVFYMKWVYKHYLVELKGLLKVIRYK